MRFAKELIYLIEDDLHKKFAMPIDFDIITVTEELSQHKKLFKSIGITVSNGTRNIEYTAEVKWGDNYYTVTDLKEERKFFPIHDMNVIICDNL